MKTLFFVFLLSLISSFLAAQTFTSTLEKGDEYYMNGDYTNAVIYFSKAIKISPKNDTGYWYRGDAYNKLEKYNEAINDYSAAIKINPNYWKYYLKRAVCNYNLEKYQLAISDYTKAIELNPMNEDLWYYRGDSYLILNKKDSACVDFQKAHHLQNKDALNAAIKMGCEWTKNIPSPSKCKVSSYVSNDVDAFTAISFVSKGLWIKSYEIEMVAEGSYLTGNILAMNDEIRIKILKPQGFCPDSAGNVFYGMGFKIENANKMVEAQIEDVYADKQQSGVPATYLSSLSYKSKFKDLILGEPYTLTIRFFDKRSEAELLVIFPFIVGEKTTTSNSISTSKGVLGLGINSKAVAMKFDSLIFLNMDKGGNGNIYKLEYSTNYTLGLGGMQDVGKKISCNMLFINKYGETIKTIQPEVNLTSNSLSFPFSTQYLPSGNYTLLIQLKDELGGCYNVLIPTNQE